MKAPVYLSLITIVGALASSSMASEFTLSSKDIAHGEFMSKQQEFTGFGCEGGDTSPALAWHNPPKNTAAFALMVFDPDAPTGSGWWHWQLVNIPKDVTHLESNVGNPSKLQIPEGSMTTQNDYGANGFGGACPPPGDGAHRYQFTIHALSKELELPKNPSAALVGYMVNAHSLASSTIEALYKR